MNQMNSAAMCRQQEAIQRELAAGTTLPNVRRIALAAALAWAQEAQEAEGLEDGDGRILSAEDAAIAREFLTDADQDDRDSDGDDDADAAGRDVP